ncbi:MAG: hypothetical protein V7K48_03870 [Nostoc sp.]|uniref:hypothetical protein n=1 Tax=Nostoc sp. TaxID=1180 RepID=UPI002FF8A694
MMLSGLILPIKECGERQWWKRVLLEENFAIVCPFAVDEILDLDFYPNADQ